MAAPKIQPTRAEWEARALELAAAKHLTGTARRRGVGQFADVFTVPSGDRCQTHEVWLDHASGKLRCDCVAASYGRPCSHAGAVLHAERQRRDAMRCSNSSGEPLSWWLRGGEWA
ncbi:MAG TPA: hypothetical protein VF916_15045 [Ktedonobacterales bacterium]